MTDKTLFPFITVIFIFLATGCSHNLRITNVDQYFTPPSAPSIKETIKIGVTSSNVADLQTSRYVNAIVEALQRNSMVEKVIYPYSQAVHQVDTVVDITLIPHYTGSGSNFFVNWPGFLIFAPAIWGYGYNADIDTKVNVTRLIDNRSQQIEIPTKWKFRQAEMDRTWTEVGWFEVGLIPLIGGFVFMDYDHDVTDEFITKVSPNYASHVAGKIMATVYSLY